MGRCWTCGSEIPHKTGFWYTCNICNQTKEIVKVRKTIEAYEPKDSQAVIDFSGIDFGLSEQFSEITYILERGFSGIASAIEWGFEDLSWRMEQMTGVLKSIDKTLKTPSQTQANEWRLIGEELRRRKVLDEAKEFLLKSRKTNPLDYRTYIDLGKTYLQMGNLEAAKSVWTKSLYHAPKGKIDYRSYSYRLLGRIFFCQEDYQTATLMLEYAIKVSPNYYLGHYDYAQYCALVDDREKCLSSLRIAILKGSIPIELVAKERNFNRASLSLKKEIGRLLKNTDLLWEIYESKKKINEAKIIEANYKKIMTFSWRKKTMTASEAMMYTEEIEHDIYYALMQLGNYETHYPWLKARNRELREKSDSLTSILFSIEMCLKYRELSDFDVVQIRQEFCKFFDKARLLVKEILRDRHYPVTDISLTRSSSLLELK